jgi:hypothetical protein
MTIQIYSSAKGEQFAYERVGDGCLLVDESPFGGWRFIWLPDDVSSPPVRRYGNEGDYPKQTADAVFEWVRIQSWASRSIG